MMRVSAGAAALLALGLAGCVDYGTRNFGVQRGAHDQTRVTSLPPLSLPPILTERMSDGAPPPPDQPAPGTFQAQTAAAQATSASSRRGAASTRAPGPGETSLLDAAGPSAPGDIRARVDEDAQIGRIEPHFSDSIMARANGPSATISEPIIQRGGKSWLDSIF